VLFNIFIDDLLVQLSNRKHGVIIGGKNYSSFAYADDVTLLSSRVSDLQEMIDICVRYSEKWRFKYSKTKSCCMITSSDSMRQLPSWTMKDTQLPNKPQLDILGIIYSQDRSPSKYLELRKNKCRRAAFGLAGMGFCYPGSHTSVKEHLWKTICAPTLTYGMEAISMPKKSLREVESTQGTIMKTCLGLPKWHHHS